MRIRTLILLSACIVSLSAARAEEVNRPAGELDRYIVVLRDRFDPGATEAERARKVSEPDYAALGGRMLQTRSNRRLVELTPQAAEALKKNPDVAYMQRLWDGVSAEPGSVAAIAPVVAQAEIAATSDTPSWTTGTYGYDGSGNIRGIGADTYAYDTATRLVRATVAGKTETYSYDAFGNLPNADPLTNRLNGRQYTEAGHMKTDANGRPYLYDALGMINGLTAEYGGDRRMIYTAADERLAVVTQPGTTDETTRLRVRDFGNRVLREFTKTATGWEWTRDWVYAEGKLVGGERQVAGTQNGFRHYHLDHLGSIRLITRGGDAARLADPVYSPFGNEITSSTKEGTVYGYYPLEPLKFTGHERDYTGAENDPEGDALDYMHARYYDGGVGRFLSVDPEGFWTLQSGSDDDRRTFRRYLREPQRWNRYAYVRNNPLNAIDPDGRSEFRLENQLQREQLAVINGEMTMDEYHERNAMRAGGALTGLTIAAGGYGLIRLGMSAYGAYQAWRAASAAAATIKAIEQVSRGDARIFQTAMNLARGSANTFVNNLTALSRAVEQVVGPQGRITQIGTIGGQAVWGSARTGFGITVINGVTKIVQMLGDDKYRIIGNFK